LRVEEPFEASLLDDGPAGDALGDLARAKVDRSEFDGSGISFFGGDGALQVGDKFLLVFVCSPVLLPLAFLGVDIVVLVAGVLGEGPF
jgi:hypothetical protein